MQEPEYFPLLQGCQHRPIKLDFELEGMHGSEKAEPFGFVPQADCFAFAPGRVSG